MKMTTKIALGSLALAMTGPALACTPLNAYRVQGVSARSATPAEAVGLLLEGTAWKADVDAALDAPITLRGVSGPLDRVLEKVLDGLSSSSEIAMLQDTVNCVVRVSVRRPAVPAVEPTPMPALAAAPSPVATPEPAALPAPTAPVEQTQFVERVIEVDPFVDTRPIEDTKVPAPRSHMIESGSRLSEALAKYVEERGWSLRWMLEDDYLVDVDVPVPPLDVIDGVTWVVTAYQAQGGLRGVSPRFATPNKVVVIEAMNIREDVR